MIIRLTPRDPNAHKNKHDSLLLSPALTTCIYTGSNLSNPTLIFQRPFVIKTSVDIYLPCSAVMAWALFNPATGTVISLY